MIKLFALAALGIVGVYYLSSSQEPSPKPAYVPGGHQGWYAIEPLDPQPSGALAEPVRVGDIARYWLGDGHDAKKGEVVTKDNSRVVIGILAVIDGGKDGTGPTGDTYPATVISSLVFRGELADAPTQLPRAGTRVTVQRNLTLISHA